MYSSNSGSDAGRGSSSTTGRNADQASALVKYWSQKNKGKKW